MTQGNSEGEGYSQREWEEKDRQRDRGGERGERERVREKTERDRKERHVRTYMYAEMFLYFYI